MAVALSLVFFTDKTLTAQEALILKNVEAIAGGEETTYLGCTQTVHDVYELMHECDNKLKPQVKIFLVTCLSRYQLTDCWQGERFEEYNCGGIMINSYSINGWTIKC